MRVSACYFLLIFPSFCYNLPLGQSESSRILTPIYPQFVPLVTSCGPGFILLCDRVWIAVRQR